MTLVRRVLLGALAFACGSGADLDAAIQPSSPVAEKVYRHPSLHIPHQLQPPALLPPGLAASVERDMAALGLGADSAFYDPRAGRLTSLIVSEPLIPGTGTGNTLEWNLDRRAPDDSAMGDAAWAAVLGYLRRHEAVLRVDVAELADPRIAVHEHGGLIQIHAQRMVNGILVRDAGLTAGVNHGNLVLLGLDNWGDGPWPAALIDADQARSMVAQHAQPFLIEAFPKDAHLEYVPMAGGDGYDFRLVWVVRATVQGDAGTWEGLVDAVSGDLIAFEDRNQYAVRKAIGGVYPVSNDQNFPDGIEQVGWPMPFLNVNTPGGTVTTNVGGVLGCATGSISTSLAGRYVSMSDACGAASETSAAGELDLAFGPTAAATDCAVPAGHSAGDTKASRTGFYELNRIIEQARGYLPANPWLQSQLTANMNINLTCNAFWNGSTVNFYRDLGSQCRNTGEIAAIFDHEWGHGLDNNGVNPNLSSPGEAIADIHGILRLNNSCMGRGFLKSGTCGGYGDPCTVCTGIRELDWARHFSSQPHNIQWIFATCPAAGQRGPCNRETHCEGHVAAESGWDLYARDLQAPPFGLDVNTALELSTRLAYLGSQLITNWYQCSAPTQTGDGCAMTNGYMQYLFVDDDNGNLLDGTPHMTAIHAAFNRHGIACPTPTVQNGGCLLGPSTASTLTVTAQDQGAALSWTAVPNAVSYSVYRTEGTNGANFGKVKIAEVTSTAFVDSNLQNNRQYFFNVMPVGASSSCLGPMSTSAAVTPASGLNLAVRPTVSVTVTGGDGDGLLDNCESATIGFTVDNNGSGTLTNVRVVAVTPITHPASTVTTPLPFTLAASLAECAEASGSVSIRAQGMSFDETTQFRIDVTADGLAQVRSVIASVSSVETDFQAVGSRTYNFNTGMDGWTVAGGTFNRVQANPGDFYLAASSCVDNQCDIVRSPVVRLQAGSTLSLAQRYDTETPVPVPYDRANVGVFEVATGTRTVVVPDGGDPYDLAAGASNGSCETTLQAGWAADTDVDCTASAPFVLSSWTAAALNPGGIFTGRSARLSVHYGTDGAASGYGFHFDNVTLTNFQEQVPDVQSNTCAGCATITVSPATIPAGTAGTAYSQTFTQTGAVAPVTWSVTGALPAGVTLNPATGVLSGTPTQTGSFPIIIVATGANGCGGSRSYTLVINCQTVTVNPTTISAATVGSPYSQTFTQAGGIGAITWSLTGTLPTGLSFNAATGVLSGTPTQTGTFPITVRATDANGCFGSRSYSLVVNCQSIAVNPATVPAGTAGTAYSQTFTQSGAIGTVTWSLSGTLPTGMSFNPATGVLSGTPTQIGSFPFIVSATDSNGCIGSRGYSLVIGCQTITVNPTTIPAGTVGTAYSQTFTQAGAIGTVTWSLTGTLPTGMSFNASTGVLSGTPTQTGSFPITVRATDANNCFGTRAYTLVIGCQTITVNPTTIPAGTAGTAYSQTFTQAGAIGTVTWSLSGTLPTGVTFNTSTGVLSGTPTQTGSFPITVTATDANGCIGSRAYTLVIGCQTITVNPTTIPAGTAGTPYSQTFTQAGAIGTVTWSLTGTLPTGVTFNTSTGVLSGTPTQTGSFPITVTATDANGCIGSRAYTLVIGCQTITVNPTTIPAGTAGTPYSQTFTQAGAIGTVTWSLTGTLPTGLSFNTATGVLSGTPTQTGSFPITVTATDANGCIGSRAYTLVIGCQTITVNPPAIPPGTAGVPYSQTFTQTSGIGAITWSLTGALPTGLTFNPSTGVLSGTPTQIGSFPITVTATDANGCLGTRPYTLVINAAGPFVPTALNVDAAANRVFEPGETVVVAPSWRNDTGAAQGVTGVATNFIGPGTATYTITDGTASYGTVAPGVTATCSSGGDCYGLAVSVPNPRPSLHWDSTVVETLSSSHIKTWTLHIGNSFTDVPTSNGFYRFIETILHKQVTGGCGGTAYCPANPTTRDQLAVFVLVSKEGPAYVPPACGTPMFADVPASSPFCRWVEELARRGVVGGCGGGNYCPTAPATREQMAVFVLRTLDPALNPPACGTPMFADVPASSPFCRWIEELARRGVVTGCGGGNYCPTANVSREQMAVFLAATFGLVLYGP